MLHGDIKVNNTVIGEWTAVRKEELLPTEFLPHENHRTTFRYACTINFRSMGGYPMGAEFDVLHPYGDGALLLAAKVLAKGYAAAKRKPLEV